MNYKEWTVEELETRKAAIGTEAESVKDDEAKLTALTEELRAINAELETRKANAKKLEEVRKMVAAGSGVSTRNLAGEIGAEKAAKTVDEIRSSKEYVNAFANYIKTGDDKECRALLTTNVSGGVVPVPTVIEGRIRTAWERNGLMRRVRRTFIRGNVQIGFELTATGAVVHTEGSAAPAEETLTFGVVNLVPETIKKWIRISDEALDLGGEEFLFYVYDELTYRIAQKAQELLVARIAALPTTATATSVSADAVAGTPGVGIIAEALGHLSGEARDNIVVINKQTWALFKAAQYAGNFNVDPFEGLEVEYDNSLPVYDASATAGTVWGIVGDFGIGAHANFPNGDEIRIKYDDLSEAESDLVKVVGREFVAIQPVADKAFVNLTVA